MSPPTIPAGTASIRPNPDRRSSVEALMVGARHDVASQTGPRQERATDIPPPRALVPSGDGRIGRHRSAIVADGIDPQPDPAETEDDPADDEPDRGQSPEQPEDRRQDADDDQPRGDARESARRYRDDGEDDRP